MSTDYLYQPDNPHTGRRQKMLEKYPQIKEFYKPYPLTFLISVLVVVSQCVLAYFFQSQAWYWMLLGAYTIGAVLNHNQFVIVHEATHNSIFRTTFANKWAGIIAGLPQIFPSAIAFRKFHLLHHSHQGQMDFDADLPSPKEAELVGNSSFLKCVWLFHFFLVQGAVRPSRLKHIKWIDKWFVLNLGVQALFSGLVIAFIGWQGFFYLLLSTIFCLGLHPLGARWIQEHYVFKEGQETYSYYGPVNWLNMNIGYHNEHHDFLNVPWVHLPKIKKLAPEFYDNLLAHTSYTRLLFRFLFDKKMDLKKRYLRPDATTQKSFESQALPKAS